MTDVEYMDELDNAANMRAIIAKLPYKLKERWRSMVCGIQDNCRAKFNDLMDFNQQAKDAWHPLFGNIKDFVSRSQAKGQVDEKLHRRSSNKRGFTTAATIASNQAVSPKSKPESKITGSQVSAFSKPSVCFVRVENILWNSLHKENIDFLPAKGLFSAA